MIRVLCSPYDTVARLLVGGGLVVVAGWLVIALVTERHERRAAEAQVCAAQLAAWRTTSPLAARLVIPVDPCTALRVVSR